MTLQHIVLFSFPARAQSADEAAEMRAMVASWPQEIGLMTKCRLGTDITGARTRGYPLPALHRVPRRRRDDRLPRPSRCTRQFLAWLNERDCIPLAFDYDLDDQTVLMPE